MTNDAFFFFLKKDRLDVCIMSNHSIFFFLKKKKIVYLKLKFYLKLKLKCHDMIHIRKKKNINPKKINT
jgi:hypothetical protein